MHELKRRSEDKVKKERRRTVGMGKGIITGDDRGRVRIRDILFDSEVDNF